MPDAPPAIAAHGLVKHFGDVRALDRFDIEVDAGTVHGLVGPNGAGKTTFLRVLFDLVAVDDGSLAVLGVERDPDGSADLAGVAGFVEDPRFYSYLTGRRNLELLADLDGVEWDRVDEVLEVVRLGDGADRKVGGYSSGMRQRLGMAAALLRSPRVLLLDEPTVGLDPAGAREVLLLVREMAAGGGTVLISSHHMTELEGACDGVTVVAAGRSVWHGSMERLRAEAPAPAHRLWTSDDARAMELAAGDPAVGVIADPEGGLTVSAEGDVLDGYVLVLGRAGVAVRRLELLMTPLESMFLALTGEREEEAVAGDRPDEVGAIT
ncbi:MAG TPA: ABC transporter ATP-binding protein [Actinomycetota bacterium]|nr:ABC transporter ATP-binding protein [Actinomycetota bacterium]